MVKIFIGNIADGARSSELKSMFEKYGTVSECSILTNFGFVHMDTEDDAFAAVKGLDGAFFSGSTIKVEMSHGKNSRGGRGGRGGPRGRGRGRGGFRDRGRDRYDDYGRDRDYYSRSDPYARDPYPRDTYSSRDPYRDPYSRDAYDRRAPPRDDLYDRRAMRDPYASYSNGRDMYGAPPRDPYAAPRMADPYSRDRSPLGRRDDYGVPSRRTYDSSSYDLPRSGSPIGTRRY